MWVAANLALQRAVSKKTKKLKINWSNRLGCPRGIVQQKIKTYVSSKKITSLFRVSISDTWLRNVYLLYSLSRGTVVILFLGNICLYFLRRITQGSQWRNRPSLEINWGDSTACLQRKLVQVQNKYWNRFGHKCQFTGKIVQRISDFGFYTS